MALLTVAQLQTDMGRDSRPFTTDETGTAQFIIDKVTAFIESECVGISFEPVTVVDEKMQADFAGLIEIRKFPVNDVTMVKNKRSGLETYWDWDEFDTIFDLDPFETVLVSYTYGFTTPPTDLQIVARSLAFRYMSNPLNVRQQTVGAISETYGNVDITDQDEKILDKYRAPNSSLRLGPQTARNLRKLPTL